MGEQTKNMLIGIFVVAACFLIVSLIMFLKPSVGDGKQTLYVRFSNINKINVGTRVMFAGKPVGEVVAIDEIYDARKAPATDMLGRIYFYQLVLKIDSSVKVYDTDEISIQTSGLLGEKSIAIIPKAPPKGITPKLVTNQPIYAESVDPIENAMNELSDLSNNLQVTIKEVNRWLQKNGDDLGNAVRSFGSAMDEVKTAVKSANDLQLVSGIKTGVDHFSSTMCDIQDAVREMKDGKVFANASVVMRNLKNATHSFDLIGRDIASGRGTLGKLIKGDDLYLRFTAVMSKANTLMNDINHYGLLFHLNKSWQRQRAQRLTVLNSLDNPQSFKNYFENEVDDINTAMSRLSMLIDRAELSPEKEVILNNDKFKQDFAELLRQADALSDNLRLYNQQLMEASN
ncbi:MAG: MCE family protein [Parachlamydiales bacterium]|nr:MCE family protein [Verrucomicrobiota bacterium]MBX3719587.1 MCE family protein [Candidatus Acheromyda pituitae]